MKKHFTLPAICLLSASIAQANNTLQQEDMIVTAKAPVTAEQFSGAVTTISADEIQLSGATNILEAIQMVPGISVNNVSSRATGRSGVSIRGMENNHTLILIDGKRVSNTDTNVPFSDFQYNWVPLIAVERIEVVRGPMSNLYGSSALGGVINIITKSAGKSWGTTVEAQNISTLSGEGGGGHELSLHTSGPIGDKFDLAFSIETQDVDPFLKNFPANSTSANKEGKDNLTTVLKAGVDLNANNRVGFNYVKSDDDRFQFPNNLSYELEREQTSLDWTGQAAGFNLAASVYRSSSDNDLTSQTYTHKLEEDVATFDINGKLSDKHYLTAGVEYSKETYHKDYDAASDLEFRDSFKSWSAFAQDRFDITDRVSLTWGARYDDHERFGNAISPKAYVNWDLNDSWLLKAGYSEGFKAPAVKDASDDYYFTYSYPIAFGPMGPTAFLKNDFIGNSDIEEETSQTFEVGANYSAQSLSGGFTLFRTDVKNLISTNEISRVTFGPVTTSTNRYENVANADIFGVEAEMSYKLTSNFSTDANISYIDHEDSATGNWLTLRSKVEANLILAHNFPEKGLKSRLQVQYNGKQYQDSVNTNVIPSTTVVDASIRKSLGQHAYATFSVKNLLNDYAAEEDTNDGTSETGRQFLLTIGANF